MAVYEYVCQDCGSSFELRRPMAEADHDVTCPEGHGRVRRKLSIFAAVGAAGSAVPGSGFGATAGGGGCCGGGCGCRH